MRHALVKKCSMSPRNPSLLNPQRPLFIDVGEGMFKEIDSSFITYPMQPEMPCFGKVLT